VQELDEHCPQGVLPHWAPFCPGHSSRSFQVPVLRMGQETALHSPASVSWKILAKVPSEAVRQERQQLLPALGYWKIPAKSRP